MSEVTLALMAHIHNIYERGTPARLKVERPDLRSTRETSRVPWKKIYKSGC